MEKITFKGWANCIRLCNGETEVIVTTDVGPRIIRFGFVGRRNVFEEIPGQLGGSGENEWMIRGGHRFWIAPEEKPKTYEADNSLVPFEEIEGGVRIRQPVGALSGLAKTLDVSLDDATNDVRVVHTLENPGDRPVRAAPWALSVMARGGCAVIPLPARLAHSERLTHNQEWSLWGYTDFSDPRWTFGSHYIFFRQDAERGPNKLGILHREGWVAYLVERFLFVKRFDAIADAEYPDGNVNFETFSNEDFLELESLGPIGVLEPGASVTHAEHWSLHAGVAPCATDEEVDAHVRPLV